MPLRLLISGPAGGGKSQLAVAERDQSSEPTVIADFQSLFVALTGVVRGPDGKYPNRDQFANLLPMVETLRRTIIDQAVEREIGVIATNSDGSPERREALLERLGAGSIERIVDPGRAIVEARLSDSLTGELSQECSQAIGRWYDRI